MGNFPLPSPSPLLPSFLLSKHAQVPLVPLIHPLFPTPPLLPSFPPSLPPSLPYRIGPKKLASSKKRFKRSFPTKSPTLLSSPPVQRINGEVTAGGRGEK
jgi:hypothetical protein